MNQPINFSSRQIADSDNNCMRQIVSVTVDLAANEPYELNLAANAGLKQFGDPKGLIISTSLASVLAIVASSNQQVTTKNNYTAVPIFGVEGDRIVFLSTTAGVINFIVTDFEIDPVTF